MLKCPPQSIHSQTALLPLMRCVTECYDTFLLCATMTPHETWLAWAFQPRSSLYALLKAAFTVNNELLRVHAQNVFTYLFTHCTDGAVKPSTGGVVAYTSPFYHDADNIEQLNVYIEQLSSMITLLPNDLNAVLRSVTSPTNVRDDSSPVSEGSDSENDSIAVENETVLSVLYELYDLCIKRNMENVRHSLSCAQHLTAWLLSVRDRCHATMEPYEHTSVLNNVLLVLARLVLLMPAEEKYRLAVDPDGPQLLHTLVDHFLYAPSVERRRQQIEESRNAMETNQLPRSATVQPVAEVRGTLHVLEETLSLSLQNQSTTFTVTVPPRSVSQYMPSTTSTASGGVSICSIDGPCGHNAHVLLCALVERHPVNMLILMRKLCDSEFVR